MSVSNIQILHSVAGPLNNISNDGDGLSNGNQLKQQQQQKQLLPNVQHNKLVKIVNGVNIKPKITPTNSQNSVNSIVTKNHPNQIDEFRKLFAALFEIKDANVRSRVMKAINGTPISCPQCGFNLQETKAKGQSTISTNVPITTDITNTTNKHISVVNDGNTKTFDNTFSAVGGRTATIVNNSEELSTMALAKKYQFKRQPYAIKGVLSNSNNFATIPRNGVFKSSNNTLQLKKPPTTGTVGAAQSKNGFVKKIPTVDCLSKHNKQKAQPPQSAGSSADYLTEYNKYYDHIMSPYSDYYLQQQCVNETTANLDLTEDKLFMQTMEKEWHVALKFDPESKLLPIHTAALMGDINRLKRQILVFEYRKLNLEFKSIESDGNTALHYAAISTSKNAFDIVDYLLEKGIKLTVTNNNGDSVLQYAAKYCDNLEMFRKLLKSIDSYQDLLHDNDNGLPLLHIIVNCNKFLFAQALIETINEKLGIKDEIGENCWNADELIELYHNHISSFIRPNNLKLQLNKRKMEMLNKRDSVSGRTALFNAVRAELKEFVYLLLANYADPRIKDMNDIDCTICNEDTDRVINAAIYNADFLYKFHIDPYFMKLVTTRRSILVNNNNDNNNTDTSSSISLTVPVTGDGDVINEQLTSPPLPQTFQLKRKIEVNNDEKIVKKIC